MKRKKFVKKEDAVAFIEDLIGSDLHAKRTLSLANATVGVLASTSLSIHAIGHGLAYAYGATSKHSIKQVDRLLSNQGVVLNELFPLWVKDVLGQRQEAVVALDWTDFEKDGQATLELSLVTSHGRATPLMWRTVLKSELRGQRQQIESWMLLDFAMLVEGKVKVTVLADRGFDDHAFLGLIQRLKNFEYVIRFRGSTIVTDSKGEQAGQGLGRQGRQGKNHPQRSPDTQGFRGRNYRLHAGQEDEGRLVPGIEQAECSGEGLGEVLCQALEHRSLVPGSQRPKIWPGTCLGPDQESRAPRSTPPSQGVRSGLDDAARGCW